MSHRSRLFYEVLEVLQSVDPMGLDPKDPKGNRHEYKAEATDFADYIMTGQFVTEYVVRNTLAYWFGHEQKFDATMIAVLAHRLSQLHYGGRVPAGMMSVDTRVLLEHLVNAEHLEQQVHELQKRMTEMKEDIRARDRSLHSVIDALRQYDNDEDKTALLKSIVIAVGAWT